MPLQTVGRKALEPHQIALKTNQEPAVWETKDLVISYTMEDLGDSFILAGTVKIDDRVTYSYPFAVTFNVYVSQLNGEGIATSRRDVGANASAYKRVPDGIVFKRRMEKSEDTEAIAFSYWGTFRESGGGIEADELEIFYSPFER